jgi:hypothetical protein
VPRIALSLVVLSSFALNLSTQTAETQQSPTAPAATKDPQAVSVLNQAVAVAGGATAIAAVSDYTAMGNITYHWTQDVQGSLTVQARWPGDVRVDASLPTGVRSRVISDGRTGTKTESGAISQYPPSYTLPSSDAYAYQPPMFPATLVLPELQLAAVLRSSRFNLFYKGIVQLNGQPVHDVQAQLIPPVVGQTDIMAEYHTMDFFIDTSTYQLIVTQDSVPKHIVHRLQYSNYTAVNGLLVPFAVAEQTGCQQTWHMQLTQINFNTGLQDPAFALQ